MLRVPNLSVARISADCEVSACLRPGHGSDSVGRRNLAELGNLLAARRPDVDCRAQSDCQNVLAGPIDKVQVKVILEAWRIEHLKGYFWNLAHALQLSGVRRHWYVILRP